MRTFDKTKNMLKANILAESRYMESKGLIKEGNQKDRNELAMQIIELSKQISAADNEKEKEELTNDLNNKKNELEKLKSIKEVIDINPADDARGKYGDYEGGQQDYEDIEALKHDINIEKETLDEATTSWKNLMAAVRSGVSPYSLVVVDKALRKVVKQEINIKTGQAIPAHYESLRKEFPNALIHLEDSEGSRLWSN